MRRCGVDYSVSTLVEAARTVALDRERILTRRLDAFDVS